MAEINDLNIADASNTARFPENQAPSTINNGARATEGIIARGWKDCVEPSLDSTGSGGTYAVSANRTLSAYYDGMVVRFHANHANDGAATLNVDAVGAKAIVKHRNVALDEGDIVQHQVVEVVYSASDDTFQMMSHAGLTLPINNQTGTTYTLTAADNGHLVTLSNASAITLTVPETSTATLPLGFQCVIMQLGAGQVTVAKEGSDTLASKSSATKTSAQYSSASIIKIVEGSPNTWYLGGDITV